MYSKHYRANYRVKNKLVLLLLIITRSNFRKIIVQLANKNIAKMAQKPQHIFKLGKQTVQLHAHSVVTRQIMLCVGQDRSRLRATWIQNSNAAQA